MAEGGEARARKKEARAEAPLCADAARPSGGPAAKGGPAGAGSGPHPAVVRRGARARATTRRTTGRWVMQVGNKVEEWWRQDGDRMAEAGWRQNGGKVEAEWRQGGGGARDDVRAEPAVAPNPRVS